MRSAEESKTLNELTYPFIVIAASGMCEAGRILHHLRRYLPDPRNTVLIAGFQAEHTLGRKILDGHPTVPVFGDPTPVRAEVDKLNELSGHADQHELLEWIKPIAKRLKGVFLVHGEQAQREALAAAIRERYGLEATLPAPGDSFDLDA